MGTIKASDVVYDVIGENRTRYLVHTDHLMMTVIDRLQAKFFDHRQPYHKPGSTGIIPRSRLIVLRPPVHRILLTARSST